MPRGGARPGAGRKPKVKPPPLVNDQGQKTEAAPPGWPFGTEAPPIAKIQTPLEYLLEVMNDPAASPSQRLQAAVQAAPYVHPKAEAKGKKGESADRAKVAAGKFSATPPPLRAVK